MMKLKFLIFIYILNISYPKILFFWDDNVENEKPQKLDF